MYSHSVENISVIKDFYHKNEKNKQLSYSLCLVCSSQPAHMSKWTNHILYIGLLVQLSLTKPGQYYSYGVEKFVENAFSDNCRKPEK